MTHFAFLRSARACRPQALVTCLLVVVATNVVAAPMQGVWRGNIGKYTISACFEGELKAAYHYDGHQGEIGLMPQATGWLESVNGAAGASWSIVSVEGDKASGIWRNGKNSKELSIVLARVAHEDRACSSVSYKGAAPTTTPTTTSKAGTPSAPILHLPLGSVQIAANRGAAIIKADGGLWLLDEQTRNVPKRVGTDFVKVALGDRHGLGIKTDGSLWGWGDNTNGQLGGDDVDGSHAVNMGSGYVEVAGGQRHSYAIKSDGTLWEWGGMDTPGKFSDGPEGRKSKPTLLGNNFRTVAGREEHFAGIKKDDTLWMWGRNMDSQISATASRGTDRPVLIGPNFVQVSVGYAHTAAIKKDGSLWTWGHASWGVLGDGTDTPHPAPIKVGDDFVQVVAGFLNTAAVKKDGSLWLWGGNEHGLFGDCTNKPHFAPVKIATDVVAVAAGQDFLLATRRDGSQWTWGWARDGEQTEIAVACRKPIALVFGDGVSKWERDASVHVLPAGTPASALPSIAAGRSHSALVTADGNLWTWGNNSNGQLGDGSTENRSMPVRVGSGYRQVQGDHQYTAALKDDGSLWRWGVTDLARLEGPQRSRELQPVKTYEGTVQVLPSGYHTERRLGLSRDGMLWDWQYDSNIAKDPVKVGHQVRSMAAAEFGSFAIRTDNSLWLLKEYPVEVPLQIGRDFIQIVSTRDHAYGLKLDGTLWAWGNNAFAQLGDGGRLTQADPVKIASDVMQVAGGRLHGLALKRDGSLWAWGHNEAGAVGDGSTTERSLPVAVGKGFSKIAAGNYHSLALKSDGTLWAWGNNEDGQLGDGTITRRLRPVAVTLGAASKAPVPVTQQPGVTGTGKARAMGLGDNFGCALLVSGHVKCWGDNSKGQTGGEQHLERNAIPLAVKGIEHATALGVLSDHACVKASNGHILCWGIAGRAMPNSVVVDTGQIDREFTVSDMSDDCSLGRGGRMNGHCIVRCDNEAHPVPASAPRSTIKGKGKASVRPAMSLCQKIASRFPFLRGAESIASSSYLHCGLMKNGKVQCYDPDTYGAYVVDGVDEAIALDVRTRNGCVLQRDGQVKCWGDNARGELGNGLPVQPYDPAPVATAVMGLHD